MTLAEEGLPRGGSVGDEIFDQHERARHHQLPRQRQPAPRARGRARAHHRRAGRRARGAGPSGAAAARAVPARPDRAERVDHAAHARRPAASTVARCRPCSTWSPPRCPGLSPERIAVVDDQGTLLARGGEGDPKARSRPRRRSYREAYEARLKRTIEQLLERSLGPGRVARRGQRRARSRSGSRITEETFDPEGQVVRSTQTVEEESQSRRARRRRCGHGRQQPAQRCSRDAGERAHQQREHHAHRGDGQLRDLAPAAQPDPGRRPGAAPVGGGAGRRPDDAERGGRAGLHAARCRASSSRSPSLVRSAIGFDAGARRRGRGQEHAVQRRRRRRRRRRPGWTLTKYDLMRLAELAALALVALMLILLVVRPMLRASAAVRAGCRLPARAKRQAALPSGAGRPLARRPERATGQRRRRRDGRARSEAGRRRADQARARRDRPGAGRGGRDHPLLAARELGAGHGRAHRASTALNGTEKAAMFLLASGEEYASKLFAKLQIGGDQGDHPGHVAPRRACSGEVVEALFRDFVERLGSAGGLVGSYDTTERLLGQFLDRRQGGRDHGGHPRAGRADRLGQARQRRRGRARRVPQERVPADHRGRAVARSAPSTPRGCWRACPRKPRSRRVHAHAAHGAGAEGHPERRRADAARRVHVQPRAHPPPRQPRDHGGDLQLPRPLDRDPLPRAARGAQQGIRRPRSAR